MTPLATPADARTTTRVGRASTTLSPGRVEERHQTYIDLLDAIVLTPEGDPTPFARVRHRQRELQEWFALRAGWRLVAGPAFARLLKTPDTTFPGLGALTPRPAPRPLTAREYAIVCWILWVAESRGVEQVTLTGLAKELRDQAEVAAMPGYLDWGRREDRSAFVNALQAMVDQGWLARVDGTEAPYVDTSEGDVLYEFTPLATYAPVLLAAASADQLLIHHDWSAIDHVPSVDQVSSVRAYRLLLLGGAIVAATHPDVFAWARAHVLELREEFATRFGWRIEAARGHVAVLRPTQQSRWQGAFPTAQTDMAFPLLLATRIRGALATEYNAEAPSTANEPVDDAESAAGLRAVIQLADDDTVSLSLTAVRTVCSQLQRSYGQFWSAELARMSEADMAGRTLALLRTWQLGDGPDASGQVRLYPTLGRYAGEYRGDGIGLGSPTENSMIGEDANPDEIDVASPEGA